MYTYVIPFHRDYERLLPTIMCLRERRADLGIDGVLLCHNGLGDVEAIKSVLHPYLDDWCELLHTDSAGIGAGYRLGIMNGSGQYFVLSASDLPFGFSDVEQHGLLGEEKRRAVTIGSKGHARSKLKGIPPTRRFMSYCFYLLRVVLLGATTPLDSQGTLIVPCELARKITSGVVSEDYFFSIELISRASKSGSYVIEVPVIFVESDKNSSVRLGRDGFRLLRMLFWLRTEIKNK